MLEAYIIDELLRRERVIDRRLPVQPHARLPFHRPPLPYGEPGAPTRPDEPRHGDEDDDGRVTIDM